MTQFYLRLKKHKYAKKRDVINFMIFKLDSFRVQINHIKNFILHILVMLLNLFIKIHI